MSDNEGNNDSYLLGGYTINYKEKFFYPRITYRVKLKIPQPNNQAAFASEKC